MISPEVIIHLAHKKGLTIAVAESLTGGGLSSQLVGAPGASQVFLGSVVSYTNFSKSHLLNIKEEDLEKYKAVSPEIAEAMVKGIYAQLKPSIAISLTGIAGPTTQDDKPVGKVYIALLSCERLMVEEYNFKGSREQIIEQSIISALYLLKKALDLY